MRRGTIRRLRYDTRCYLMRSNADIIQLNLRTEPTTNYCYYTRLTASFSGQPG